jgi:glycosyltransferase involved in cell wall biosynthesis
MSKYPLVLIYRHDKYSYIDSIISDNKDRYNCSIKIITKKDIIDTNCLFNVNNNILMTVSESDNMEYEYLCDWIPNRFSKNWIFKTVNELKNYDEFNYNVNYNFIYNVILPRENTRPLFSIFTTCFKSYELIKIAYNSLKQQTLTDWEWVIVDDTPEDGHFFYLKDQLESDNRVRLYKRSCNSGNIGNVKNEAISLCRGKYVLELDHDDELFVDCLKDATNIFESDDKIGFVYGETLIKHRNGKSYHYGDFTCKGYGGYYLQKINGEWNNIYLTPHINNITLSHLVCLPNHPRMWRRKMLMDLDNYSEYLPICDDYEILLRTCINYKVAKNSKVQYIQYMNDDGNNFSNIRNGEINRIGPQYIQPLFYNMYHVNDKMKELDAYEDINYMRNTSRIWERDTDYQHKRCNYNYNFDYDKCICIINDGINSEEIISLYDNSKCDFIWLCNSEYTIDKQKNIIDEKKYDRIKIYNYKDNTPEQLIKWFNMLYLPDNCISEIYT